MEGRPYFEEIVRQAYQKRTWSMAENEEMIVLENGKLKANASPARPWTVYPPREDEGTRGRGGPFRSLPAVPGCRFQNKAWPKTQGRGIHAQGFPGRIRQRSGLKPGQCLNRQTGLGG